MVVDGKIIPIPAHGMKVISMGNFVDDNTPVVWRGPMLGKILRQFLTDVVWGEPDYLLLDLPPGTGDMALDVAQLMPKAAPHRGHDAAGGRFATSRRRAAQMAYKTNQRIIGVVENMSAFVCPAAVRRRRSSARGRAARWPRLWACRLLGSIPLTMEARTHGDKGSRSRWPKVPRRKRLTGAGRAGRGAGRFGEKQRPGAGQVCRRLVHRALPKNGPRWQPSGGRMSGRLALRLEVQLVFRRFQRPTRDRFLRFQPLFAVDGSHAAGACGGDRLAVEVVVHVAGHEDAGDAGPRAVVRFDVARLVHLQLPFEDLGVGLVPDGDEQAVAGKLALLACHRRFSA